MQLFIDGRLTIFQIYLKKTSWFMKVRSSALIQSSKKTNNKSLKIEFKHKNHEKYYSYYTRYIPVSKEEGN
jgi:hypothetical protein